MGAPYLARFSRDVGFHCPILATLGPSLLLQVSISSWRRTVKVRGIPHLAKNERDVGHPSSIYSIRSQGYSIKFPTIYSIRSPRIAVSQLELELAPALHGAGHGYLVGIFNVTSGRHSGGDSGYPHRR